MRLVLGMYSNAGSQFHLSFGLVFSGRTYIYADDLVIIADSLEECVRRLLIWKEAMEKKGLRGNAGKTKVMICGTDLDLLQSSGEYPCAVRQLQHPLQWLQTLGA